MKTNPTKKHLDPLSLRRRLGMNQVNFWSKLGVTQSGGSRYEKGRTMPQPVSMLLELVHLKGLDPEQVESEDFAILARLKTKHPDLYAELSAAAGAKNAQSPRAEVEGPSPRPCQPSRRSRYKTY